VLARGKYVHSIVFHEVKPDCVDDYVELVGGWYPKVASMPEMKVNLVGSWRSEVGDCDTFGACGMCLMVKIAKGADLHCSPHLGIPSLQRISRFVARHSGSPGLPGLRVEA
jgi:hypothetical protein